MVKKYKFAGEELVVGTRTLKRIRAMRAFEGVKPGDLGGFIESEDNLSHSGNAWVSDNAQVYDNTRVSDNARVFERALVFGNALVSGNAWVSGNSQVFGNAQVCGNAQVSGKAWVSGNSQVYGNAWVSSNAQVFGKAEVFGDAQVFGNAKVACGSIGGQIKLSISPPQFLGSAYPIGVYSNGLIRSGCIIKPLVWWEENITRCAEENKYTPIQIKEYEMYIELLGKWMRLYGFDKTDDALKGEP